MKPFLLLLSLSLLGAGCVTAPADTTQAMARLTTPNGRVLNVAVARTASEHAAGLSGKEDIGDGMLFCFDEMSVQSFWMLGMLVPLDMIWMRTGDVVGVAANVPLREADKIARRSSGAPVNGVLEVAAGRAETLGFVEAVDVPDVRTICNQVPDIE